MYMLLGRLVVTVTLATGTPIISIGLSCLSVFVSHHMQTGLCVASAARLNEDIYCDLCVDSQAGT
jgi:hypothetical protein